MTKNITNTTNIQDTTTTDVTIQQPMPIDCDFREAMDKEKHHTQKEHPAKPELGKVEIPKLPKQNWLDKASHWMDREVARLGKTILIIVIIRCLFEMAPTMKEEMPKFYQLYSWGAELVEWMYEFLFGFFGSFFRGQLFTFMRSSSEGLWNLVSAFIQLF